MLSLRECAALAIGIVVAGAIFLFKLTVLPPPFLPQPIWEKVFFFAFLLSAVCASVLYVDFQRSYEELFLGNYSFVVNVIPFLHGVFALAVICTSDSYYLHIVFFLAYLLLFIVWDFIILGATPRGDPGREFQYAVRTYRRDIDIPSFLTVFLMFVIAEFVRFSLMGDSPIEGAFPLQGQFPFKGEIPISGYMSETEMLIEGQIPIRGNVNVEGEIMVGQQIISTPIIIFMSGVIGCQAIAAAIGIFNRFRN